MNAIEYQMRVMDDLTATLMRPNTQPLTIHHACEDFDVLDLEGFSLRFVFDWSQKYRDVWPDVTITHAYIVTPGRRELPLELGEIPDLDKWAEECAGRVDDQR